MTKQLTKQDIAEVFREELKYLEVVTKSDFGGLVKENGVATKNDLKKLEKNFKRELKKTESDLASRIANVAINSPTDKEFNNLENKVKKLESYHNYA